MGLYYGHILVIVIYVLFFVVFVILIVCFPFTLSNTQATFSLGILSGSWHHFFTSFDIIFVFVCLFRCFHGFICVIFWGFGGYLGDFLL